MAILRDTVGRTGLMTDGDWILSRNMDQNGGIGVIQLKHVGVGEFLHKSFSLITEETLHELKCTEVLPGDILISRMADPIARACIVPRLPFRCVTAVDVTILRVDEKIADAPYVQFLCNSDFFRQRAEHAMRGTTRARITRKDLEGLSIPLPPLPEQNRIAAILAKADRLRRLRRYAHELSDTYLQSVFLEMFGDPVANPMGWEEAVVGHVIASSQYGTSNKSNSEQRGYPVLGMGNITYSGGIDLTSLSYVELSEEEFETLRLVPGDIIFNRTNSTKLVGKTAHWNYELDAVLASYLVKLKLKMSVLPDYFAALLNTRYYKGCFRRDARRLLDNQTSVPLC